MALSGRKSVPAGWTPDQPHPDPRREGFVQHAARGLALSEAYRRTGTGQLTQDTAKSNGHRMSKEPPVAARIEWLRADTLLRQKEGPATLTRDDLLDLMGEVTAGFEAAIDALERAQGSPRTVAQLRADLVTHVGRLHRMQPSRERPSGQQIDHVADALTRLQVCACAQ